MGGEGGRCNSRRFRIRDRVRIRASGHVFDRGRISWSGGNSSSSSVSSSLGWCSVRIDPLHGCSGSRTRWNWARVLRQAGGVLQNGDGGSDRALPRGRWESSWLLSWLLSMVARVSSAGSLWPTSEVIAVLYPYLRILTRTVGLLNKRSRPTYHRPERIRNRDLYRTRTKIISHRVLPPGLCHYSTSAILHCLIRDDIIQRHSHTSNWQPIDLIWHTLGPIRTSIAKWCTVLFPYRCYSFTVQWRPTLITLVITIYFSPAFKTHTVAQRVIAKSTWYRLHVLHDKKRVIPETDYPLPLSTNLSNTLIARTLAYSESSFFLSYLFLT